MTDNLVRIDRAVQSALINIEDDLYRARLQQRNNPNYVTGNGEHISDIVRHYEYELELTKKCLPRPDSMRSLF